MGRVKKANGLIHSSPLLQDVVTQRA